MSTEIALLSHPGIGIDVESIVRARLHARFTGDTPLSIKVHNAVVTGVQGAGGTDFNARSNFTVIAAQHREKTPGVRIRPHFHIFHPCPVHTDGHFVLRLTRYGAGMTADALSVIDKKTEVHFSVRLPIISEMSPGVDMIFPNVIIVRSGKLEAIRKRPWSM